jgi:hypothetical protein
LSFLRRGAHLADLEEIGDIEVSVKYGKKCDMGNLPLLATLKKGKDANAGGVDGN